MKGRPCKGCNGNGGVTYDGSALSPGCDEMLLIHICVRCDGSGEQEPRCGSRNMYGGVRERPVGHGPGHRITGRGACVWYDSVSELPLDEDEMTKGTLE